MAWRISQKRVSLNLVILPWPPAPVPPADGLGLLRGTRPQGEGEELADGSFAYGHQGAAQTGLAELAGEEECGAGEPDRVQRKGGDQVVPRDHSVEEDTAHALEDVGRR